jgi:CubicO group peptidase (beta-lactamase class C family)
MSDSASLDAALLAEVDGVFAAHHARGAAPSVAWGVFDRSGLLHFASAGRLAAGAAPRRDTVYRVASCTKSFTAAAVLSLRDAGRLSLDDPLTRFIPAFGAVSLPTTDAPVPTIRMLLTMSAGFPTDDPWADRQESISTEDLDSLITQGFSFESVPGTRFAYSNLGYALLGRVIEEASGAPYRDYVRDTFLEPLGLTCTGFDAAEAGVTEEGTTQAGVAQAGATQTGATDPAAAQAGRSSGAELALGHRWRDHRWAPLPLSAPGAFSPIGGLFTTITDLSRWAGWLAEAYAPEPEDTHDRGAPRARPANGARETESEPLSRASRREMQQLHRFAPDATAHPTGYGFGLFVEHYSRDETVVSHSGGYPGYSAHMRWSAVSGLGIVAFGNATPARVSVPAAEAFDRLLKARSSPRPALWAETRAAQEAVNRLIRREPSESDITSGSESDNDPAAGTDPATATLFADNVALDEPWERRRAAIARAITEIGGLSRAATPDPPAAAALTVTDAAAADAEESTGPAHLVWFLPGMAGRLRIEMRLNPQHPPRIQTLTVSADRAV